MSKEKDLKYLFGLENVFNTISIYNYNQLKSQLSLDKIMSLMLDNLKVIQKIMEDNSKKYLPEVDCYTNYFKSYDYINLLYKLEQTICKLKDDFNNLTIIWNKEQVGEAFCYFLYYYLNKLNFTLNTIKNYTPYKIYHKLTIYHGYLNSFYEFRKILIEGNPFLLTDEFFSDIALFANINYLADDEYVKNVHRTGLNVVALFIRYRSSEYKYQCCGSLAGSFNVMSNMHCDYRMNTDWLKRLSFKKEYGQILQGFLKPGFKNELVHYCFNDKFAFETEEKVFIKVQNVLEEKFHTDEVRFKIQSNLNHAEIVKLYQNNLLTEKTKKELLYSLNEPLSSNYFDVVFMYIHGGGFVGGDTNWYKLYVNSFVKYGAVIQPEYRKAPEDPYPAPLNDIYRMYKYLVSDEIINTLGYIPKKIVFMGESAGGNHILNFLNLIIYKNEVKKLSGLFLTEPSINICKFAFNITHLYAFKDRILNVNAIHHMLKSYLNIDSRENYTDVMNELWVNPIFASDEIVAQYPPTYIINGQHDLFCVDSLNFCRRLQMYNIPVKFDIMVDMVHSWPDFMYFGQKFKRGIKFMELGVEWILGCKYKYSDHTIDNNEAKLKYTAYYDELVNEE